MSGLARRSPSQEERMTFLKSMFKNIDTSGDSLISFDQFKNYLTKLQGSDFNHNLLAQIFRKIDKDESSTITLDEFISGYYNAQTIIRTSIDRLKQEISEYTQKHQITKRQYIETKASGIDNQNLLTVNIKSVQGLKAGLKAPIVKVTCEDNSIFTNPANPIRPTWDQSFSFYIQHGQGEVTIELFDSDKGSPTNLIGQVAVPIMALEDQQLHEDSLDLQSRGGFQGRINIGLQWVFDKIRYFEAIIQEYEEAIQEDKQELEELESYFEELEKPLRGEGKVRSGEQKEQVAVPDFINKPEFKEAENKFSDKMDELSSKLGTVQWGRACLVSTYILILLAILGMFVRPDFGNLTVGILALFYIYTEPTVGFNYKFIATLIFVTEIYDLIWMLGFAGSWLGGTGSSEDWIRRLSIFVVFLNFVGKIVFGAIFWKNSIHLN